jgi:hypothetical protein
MALRWLRRSNPYPSAHSIHLSLSLSLGKSCGYSLLIAFSVPELWGAPCCWLGNWTAIDPPKGDFYSPHNFRCHVGFERNDSCFQDG